MSILLWAVVLLLLGLVMAVLELFVPSAGVLGVLALLSLVSSILCAFADGSGTGIVFMGVVLLALPACISLAIKVWPRTPMGRRVLLPVPTTEEVIPDDLQRLSLRALVGKRAQAKSKMLPSGAIICEGQIVDATTEGLAIEPGQWLRIVEVKGTRVVVRPLEDKATMATDNDVLNTPLERLGIDPDAGPLG